MRRSVTRIIRGLVVLTVALIVTVTAILLTVDPEDYRDYIAEQASDALGRSVTLAGAIDLQIGTRPVLVVTDVRVANPAEFAEPDMAQVDRLEIVVDLFSLLGGQIEVERLAVDGASVVFARNADGDGNWVFGSAAPADLEPDGQADAALPNFADIRVSDAVITYRNAEGIDRTVAVDSLTVSAPAAAQATMNAQARIDDLPVSVDATTGSPSALLQGDEPWPLSATVALGSAQITLDGSVAAQPLGTTANLTVEASVPAGTLATVPDIALTTQLVGTPTRIELTDLQGTVGSSTVQGNLIAVLDRPRPFLGGGLTIDRLDGSDFTDPGVGEDGPLVPPMALPAVGELGFDADLGLAIAEIVGMPVADIAAELRFDSDRAELGVAQALIAGARLTGTATLTDAEAGTTVNTALRLNDLALQSLTDQVSGNATVELDFTGTGTTLREAVSAGQGRSLVTMGPAQVGIPEVDLIGRSGVTALTTILPFTQSSDVAAVNCAAVRLAIADGRLTSNGLVIDTPSATIGGEAVVDLLNERLDIVLRPQPKDVTIVPLVAPVRVHGPLAAPSVSAELDGIAGDAVAGLLLGVLNPAAILVPLVSTGSRGAGGCVTALDNPEPAPGIGGAAVDALGGAADQVGEAVGGAAGDIGDVLDEATEGLGGAINDLFGN